MKKQTAFTLIEVLFALMILSGALLAISSTYGTTLNAQKKSEKVQLISSLMKSKLTELELKYQKLGYANIPEEESGKFDDSITDLTWKAEAKELEFPDLRPLMTANSEFVDETMLSVVKQMTDHFSKNIKEIRLTVIWTTQKKTVEYSATTYFTNYSGGLPTGGGL